MLDWINLAGLVAILGTLFGIMMPMIRNTEKRLDTKIDKLDARIDKLETKVDGGIASLSAQIIDLHKSISAVYLHLPAERELVYPSNPRPRRIA